MNQTQEISRDFLQQALDARIRALEESFVESVRLLTLERNTLSPVSFLPPEIFAVIFSFMCSSEKPCHNLARLRLSHVCHQWREIVLTQPPLWSYVDFTTLSSVGAAEMLARAKSVPLCVEATISSPRCNDVRFDTFQKELQACIPRIRHLSISAERADMLSTLRVLGSPAPTLEHISLSSTGENILVPDTLSDGSTTTPRLSFLKLDHCGISWERPLWPLLKSLKHLEIIRPSSWPKLTVWLDALAEMPELKTLILNFASPVMYAHPIVIKRTVTLPSLADFIIVESLNDCVLALAHLDLPALTHLSLEAVCFTFPKSGDVQQLVPYVARYAYGTQHTQPLQSMRIHFNQECVDLLAWAVPNIGVEIHDPPTATLAPRLALSFRCDGASSSQYYSHLDLVEWLMASLPLDGVVTLAAQDLCGRTTWRPESAKRFWLHISPMFPHLRRVKLLPAGGFIEMLLEDSERPPLSSLTELMVVETSEYVLLSLPLCDALMKRVEQGVPFEVLNLRTCHDRDGSHNYRALLRRLSEIVVYVLGLERYVSINT